MSPPLVLAAGASVPALGHVLPIWSIAPFATMLLGIAVLPLAAGRLWDSNRNKAILSAALGLPVAIWMASLDPAVVAHTAHEYVSFILLLGTLFVISGGIVVRGTLAGTPGLNTILLALGALLASLVGTTGASMLLVRPLLRANSVRNRRAHVVVFFIFVVANGGGLLTPLGDPPLFLGFLRGVPFLWTLRLFLPWLFVNAVLLAIFFVLDSALFRREDVETPGDLDEIAVAHQVPVRLVGLHNLALLGGVVAVVFAAGALRPLPTGLAEGGILLMAALSWKTTPRLLRVENGYSWGPIVEVAVLFAGIFATMIPALAILNARGPALGLDEPWHFFWASGALSSFLDNAPTYLSFASAASGLVGADASNLAELIASPRGERLLVAVSLGSVLMGANTYIGNGPNFMVKAIAEQGGVRMPGFFRYMAWSGAILLPIFAAVTWLFLL
jgi:Na+/H+ antiporter NhaD/arsenite permease-like protein